MAVIPWLERLAISLDEVAGKPIREKIMQESKGVSSGSSPGKKVKWIQGMLTRLEKLLDSEQQIQVMAKCSCSYTNKKIAHLKSTYEQTKDIDALIDILQMNRIERIQKQVGLSKELIRKVQNEPFYHNPLRKGKKVYHVVCPNHIITYLEETDPEKKRAHYCHCGWIRYGKKEIPLVYCYCGVGFYKSLWENILNEPVRVVVQSSVFHGDDCCRIVIHLPL